MYTRVSSELRDKIAKDLQHALDEEGGDIGIMFFKPGEMHLHRECIAWRETINLYFLSSCHGGALKKFLNYNYIRPEKISYSAVEFSFEMNWNMSWKDWFIVEKGHDYASIITA